MKRTALRRYTRINPISKSRRARSGQAGKLGIVRLYGDDLEALRRQCFDRDRGICQVCGAITFWEARFDGDPLAFDMAHIRTKRNNGDTLDNVRVLCKPCHRKEHGGC